MSLSVEYDSGTCALLQIVPVENFNGELTATITLSGTADPYCTNLIYDNYSDCIENDAMWFEAEVFSSSQSFDITIAPVNDLPCFNEDLPDTLFFDLQEGETWMFDITLFTYDVDGDSIYFYFEFIYWENIGLDDLNVDGNLFSFSPGDDFTGVIIFEICTDDGLEREIEDCGCITFYLTWQSINDPPVLGNINADMSIDEDSGNYVVTVTPTDNDNVEGVMDDLTVTYAISNPSLFPDHNLDIETDVTDVERTITLTPGENQYGSAILQISVNDGELSDTGEIYLTVNPVNDAPIIISTAATLTYVTEEYVYQVLVEDVDDTEFIYTLENNPEGMDVSNTGLVTWSPQLGTYTSGSVMLIVADDEGATDTELFTIVVVQSDCHGDDDGSAFIDDCGNCVGGNTGVEENYAMDCAGVCFGDAELDCAGICDGPNYINDFGMCVDIDWNCPSVIEPVCSFGWTFDNDCEAGGIYSYVGVCFGDTFYEQALCGEPYNGWGWDDCGICMGDNSYCDECPIIDCAGVCFGDAEYDCADVCDGLNYEDDCGVCDDDPLNYNAVMDCNGECFGDAELDCFGICDGDATIEDCTGCMDPSANNYEPDATIDCGDECCDYNTLPPDGWEFNQSTSHSFYIFLNATIDESVLVEGEDWIGIFNGDICVGNGIWTGPNTLVLAMGDDNFEYSDGYLESGDIPTFMIYDTSADTIYNAEAIGANPGLEFGYSQIFIDELAAVITVEQCEELHDGANLISFWVTPDDLFLSNEFGDCAGQILGIIGEGTIATPHPLFPGEWLGNITQLNCDEGYWILVDGGCTLCVNGLPCEDNITYSLNAGANLISYPFPESSPLQQTIPGDVVDIITAIIGEGTIAAPHPIFPGEFLGNMSTLSGGNGYWFLMDGAIDFTFNPPVMARYNYFENPINNLFGFEYIQSSEQAFYFFKEINSDMTKDDWILAYNDDILVGKAQWQGEYTSIAVMGDDGNEFTNGYVNVGDSPQFVVLKNDTNKLTQLDGNVNGWQSNGIFFLDDMNVVPNVPSTFVLNEVFPNPFNPTATISYSLPIDAQVQILVYDMLGRKVAELVNEYQPSGYHSIIWGGSKESSGMYFVKMITVNSVLTKKVMLLK